MKYKFRKILLGVTISCAALTSAHADREAAMARCEEDSLSIGAAKERVAWAHRCGIISSRAAKQFLFNGTSRRTRPLYPSWFHSQTGRTWKAPTNKNASCRIPNYVNGFAPCEAACFTKNQGILFNDGYSKIIDAHNEKRMHGLLSLSSTATLDNLEYEARDVDHYTASLVDTDHQILTFITESGGALQVTENHPMLTATGHMKEAGTLSVGDELLLKSGNPDRITGISKRHFFGKVYNLATNANTETQKETLGQVIVAQGFLTGSVYFQNEGIKHLNRLVLRSNIPNSLTN